MKKVTARDVLAEWQLRHVRVAAGKSVEVVNGVSNAMHVAGKKNRFLVIAPMSLHADRVAACRWGSGHPGVVSYHRW
jgi:hypothetical protein